MKRRVFIAGLGTVAAWPITSQAQSATKIARIGFLGFGPQSGWTDQIEAFRAGLKDVGLVEGKNIVIDFRWAEDVDQPPALAAGLVEKHVDIILAPASTEVEPARQATQNDPNSICTTCRPGRYRTRAELGPPRGEYHRNIHGPHRAWR
jgi:putative tryptophan/tyrosine transport system substrate-binding protein